MVLDLRLIAHYQAIQGHEHLHYFHDNWPVNTKLFLQGDVI